jgi:monoamine oxidase
MRGQAAGRTPLFRALRRTLGLARAANRPGAPPVAELVEVADEARRGATDRPSRRAALRAGVAALGGAALAPGRAPGAGASLRRRRRGPRIVVVGAGLAGLRATLLLQEAGLDPTLYTAESRPGGRVASAPNLVAPGVVTEIGGEFIDSGHEDMLALVDRFGLDLIDMQEAQAGLRASYHFDGRDLSEAEVVAAFRPVAARMEADLARLGAVTDFRRSTPYARQIDRMPLAEYLGRVGASGFLYELLDAAYTTEYGLDIGRQSPLNLLFLIGTDTSESFDVFGASDERYQVRGGNARVVQALARAVQGRIVADRPLVALRPAGGGYALTFGGLAGEVPADLVILCLPFTMLRGVDLRVPMPAAKRRAIAELGYGTNAKLLLGTRGRPWRDLGRDGSSFTDRGYQGSWEGSAGYPGPAGALTLYTGGAVGLSLGRGTPAEQAARFAPAVEATFPGTAASLTTARRAFWPGEPWVRASYACYLPGQWTTIAGAEILPVGDLYFAGEHCSLDYQGYMNGAVETGRRVAARVAHRVLGG